MERRFLLAIFLTFLVLTIYQWLLPTPAPVPQPAAVSPKPTAAAPAQPTADKENTAAPAPEAPQPTAPAVVGDPAERIAVVENGVVRAEFSNRGATLTSWRLQRYQDRQGQPLDLIPRNVPAGTPRPFALRLPPGTPASPASDDAGTAARVIALDRALFAMTSSGNGQAPPEKMDARTSAVTLAFEYQDPAGLRVRKQFRIEPNSYVIGFSSEAIDNGRALNPSVQWGLALGEGAVSGATSTLRGPEGILSSNGDVERIAPGTLASSPRYEGVYDFAGVDDHYFISSAVQPGNVRVEFRPMLIPVAGADPPESRDYISYEIRFASAPSQARFFAGPKDFAVLRAVDPELVRAIYFGIFSFLSVPLLTSLNWINGFVGNYGWAIIILTILINAAMFPLRHKSVVSMRKMQEIQPEVKTIQDRYAKLKVTDPARQKMNTELMNLYRERGVNPASGCIPMLLTLPVMLAFYGLLSEAIELRGAPFMLWITDLSARDPYYVTPILMGISQVIQQKMTPTSMDPMQQKMMMIMPIVFMFIFLSMPSGLVIYWFVSNLWAIGQQYLTNYIIGPPVVRTPRPPAERRLKHVGAGKTEAATEAQ
jgi:YidC/Oxa1 family membrane protein insertase